MRRARVVVGLLVAAVAVGVVLLGGTTGERAHADPIAVLSANAAVPQEEQALSRLVSGLATGRSERVVAALEQRVRRNPHDGTALAVLGLAYQQRGRETGDSTYYRLEGLALARAGAAGAPQALVATGTASLDNTRHRFAAGLLEARRALGLEPYNASALGALGDALLNLGRYREAFRAYDRMALESPGISSFTRVANARELTGRPAAAIAADRLALEADTTIPEQVAWTITQIGNVEFNMGHYAAARGEYDRALRRYPGYVHAQAGFARVEAAQGDDRDAVALLQHVVDRLPIPAYVIWLGDIQHASGREAAARRTYALVDAIERIYAANGVRTELQTALFDLDHDRNVADALGRARTAYADAPGIYSEDAVAWGLYRTGRCEAARSHSARALRLGTRDALLVFHRAMIERCLGSASAHAWFARALRINPQFSFLWAPVARAELSRRAEPRTASRSTGGSRRT
jgi:tetratricopeptide (TPR) repeat protein